MSLGTSVRRKARRFLFSALKGGIGSRWSGRFSCRKPLVCQGATVAPTGIGGTSWWLCATSGSMLYTVKATNWAEKSIGSKPRRMRGLRPGKRRSRGRQPREPCPERPPHPKELTSRRINHAISSVIHYKRRLAEFTQRLRPIIKKGFVDTSVTSADHGSGFQFERYRFHKQKYAHLRASASRVPAVRPIFGSWLVFLDDNFGYAPPSVLTARKAMSSESSSWGFLDQLSHLAPPEPDPVGVRAFSGICRSCGYIGKGPHASLSECAENRRGERKRVNDLYRRPPPRRRGPKGKPSSGSSSMATS